MKYNRSTFSILFYLNTSKQKKSGKCPIMGRTSIDSKNTAFSIGLDIFSKDWDAQTGLAIGKSDEAKTITIIRLTLSIETPCERQIWLAKQCRATWKLMLVVILQCLAMVFRASLILRWDKTLKTVSSFPVPLIPLYFSIILIGISNNFTLKGISVFCLDMEIHKLPSSSVIICFHISCFKSINESPVKAEKTNRSRIKLWLGDLSGVDISRSSSSANNVR